MNAITARAQRWATRFIREKIDIERKFIASAQYELKGSDLHKALVHAYLTGRDSFTAEKFSPNSAGRGFSPKGGPGRTGESSRRDRAKQPGTPGDKFAGSPARVMRRLQDSGEKFYEDIDKI